MTTKTNESMNTRQKLTYRDVINSVTLNGRYEVKEATIEMMYGDAYVSLEVGMPNDEGTLAECLCRDFYSFFIGNKGGIYTLTKGAHRKYHKYSFVPKAF